MMSKISKKTNRIDQISKRLIFFSTGTKTMDLTTGAIIIGLANRGTTTAFYFQASDLFVNGFVFSNF